MIPAVRFFRPEAKIKFSLFIKDIVRIIIFCNHSQSQRASGTNKIIVKTHNSNYCRLLSIFI
jgi:hypothetical protein